MEKPKIRPHNLSTKQKWIEDNQPANDGWPEPLTDPSDRIRVSVKDGKEGSSTSSSVESYAKAEGQINAD